MTQYLLNKRTLKEMRKKIEAVKDSTLTTEHFLTLVAEVTNAEESELGHGLLFDEFVLFKYGSFNAYNHVPTSDRSELTRRTRQNNTARHLMVHVMNLINYQSQKAIVEQLFLYDKVDSYWNTSENGRRSQHNRNLSLSTTTFDRHNATFIVNCRREIDESINQAKMVSYWIDNTSHKSKVRNRSVGEIGQASNSNFTVIAAYPAPRIRSILQQALAAPQSPAIHRAIFSYSGQVLASFQEFFTSPFREYYQKSIYQQYYRERQRLDDIPHNTEDDSDLSACISSIVPFDVLENSPQSPADIINTAVHLRKLDQAAGRSCSIIMCDCFIYHSLWKSLMADAKGGNLLAPYIVPVLGCWHPFFRCMQAVVETYSFITIPLQKELFGKGVDRPNYDNCYYIIQLLLEAWSYQATRYRTILLELGCPLADHILELMDFVLPSLLDYHVALRTSNLEALLDISLNISIIFGHCGKTTYFRVTLLDAIQFRYLKSQNHVAYHFMKQCTNSRNEEIGEIMLADLGKALTFNPTKHHFETIARQFIQRRKLRNLATNPAVNKLRNYRILDNTKDAERIRQTCGFLDNLISLMKSWADEYDYSPSVVEMGLLELPKKGTIQSQPWSNIIRAKLRSIRSLYLDSQPPEMWIYDLYNDCISHYNTDPRPLPEVPDVDMDIEDVAGYEHLIGNSNDAEEFEFGEDSDDADLVFTQLSFDN